MKTFTPKHLSTVDSSESFSLLSPQYWRVAQELRASCRTPPNRWPGHYYVFPAIGVFMSCLEAFLQEQLAMSLGRLRDRAANADDDAQFAKLEDLALARHSYNDFKLRLREIYRLYDRAGVGIDTNSDEYQSIVALKELRNATTHYNPSLIAHTEWPLKLQEAFKRASPQPMNSGWVTGFSQPEVVDWAHDTTRSAVELFCRLSNSENPFNCNTTHHAFLWESNIAL